MLKNTKYSVSVRISTPEKNEILKMAIKKGIKPITESDISMYGENRIGIEDFLVDEEIYLTIEEVKKRMKLLGVAHSPVWSYLWDDPEKNIPKEWGGAPLYFGDIFSDRRGKEYFLIFVVLEGKWEYFFEEIFENYIPLQKARFVCVLE